MFTIPQPHGGMNDREICTQSYVDGVRLLDSNSAHCDLRTQRYGPPRGPRTVPCVRGSLARRQSSHDDRSNSTAIVAKLPWLRFYGDKHPSVKFADIHMRMPFVCLVPARSHPSFILHCVRSHVHFALPYKPYARPRRLFTVITAWCSLSWWYEPI